MINVRIQVRAFLEKKILINFRIIRVINPIIPQVIISLNKSQCLYINVYKMLFYSCFDFVHSLNRGKYQKNRRMCCFFQKIAIMFPVKCKTVFIK